jgi:hypothetical protein
VVRAIFRGFRPNKVVAFRPAGGDQQRLEKLIALVAAKSSTGPVTTYLCRDFACQAPLVGAEAVEAL